MVANTAGFFQWEVFSFMVTGYTPTYPWFFMMHQGANWDTFGPLDMSLCSCANCDSGWVQRIILPCTIGYPDTSTTRSNSIFNEDEVLYSYAISNNLLQLFYTDEHALTLGVSQVTFANGSSVTFPTTPTPSSPTCVFAPDLQLGSTIFDSNNPLSGVDLNGPSNGCIESATLPCGRPMAPVLFVTDITSNPTSRSGDWQAGGTPFLPQKLCGTWKFATKIYDKSGDFKISTPSDPTQNINSAKTGWYLGQSADPLPYDFVSPQAKGLQTYGAEAAWYIDQLGLDPSKTYRFQFMVHDGDQNNDGGDVGEGCIEATSACPPGFTGLSCTACDTNPLPVDNSYTWYCFPIANSNGNYQLIKIPRSRVNESFYEGGFVPGPGVLDPNGFNTTCDCKLITYSCPQMCCGNGECAQQNGKCTCYSAPGTFAPDTCCLLPPPTPSPTPTPVTPPDTPVAPVAPPISTPTSAPTPTPHPCYNNGFYCNGKGWCNGKKCNCTKTGFFGDFCNETIPVDVQITCEDITAPTCTKCMEYSLSVGLMCVWCSNGTTSPQILVTGECIAESECSYNSSYNVCPTVTNYVPEVCPDSCTGNGVCVNATSKNYDAAKAAAGNITGQNVSAFCFCNVGFFGINCGFVPPDNSLAVIVASSIGVGALIGIIIGAIAIFGASSGGAAYAIASGNTLGNSGIIVNNPIYLDTTVGGTNPLNKAS